MPNQPRSLPFTPGASASIKEMFPLRMPIRPADHPVGMVSSTRQVLGAAGEAAAAAWLEARGYQILARNVRTRHGEIDLVARVGAVVVFIEVKSRTGSRFGHPAEAIVAWKQHRLARLAAVFLHRLGLEHCVARFDAIAVSLDRGGRVRAVEHIPDAFHARQ